MHSPRQLVQAAVTGIAALAGLAGSLPAAGAAQSTAPHPPAAAPAAAIDSAGGPGAGARAPVDSALVEAGDDELLIEEIFQSHLPTTLQRFRLRLSLHPHLGDLQNRDHLRITTGLRYGLTEHCEVSVGSNLFFSHGGGEVGSFERYGAANLRFGTKINLRRPFFRGWDTAIGADFERPLGHPPAELTDGMRHLIPYVTFSHRLTSRPDLRIFVGFRLDDVTRTTVAGTPGKNALRESSTGITGGWVIDRDNWHYTLESSYHTTRLIGQADADVVVVRPGVIWEIPSRRHPGSRGHWVAGAAVSGTFGSGGNSLGASFKLRYSRELKNRFHRPRAIPAP